MPISINYCRFFQSQLECAVVVLIADDIKKPVNILTIDMLSLAVSDQVNFLLEIFISKFVHFEIEHIVVG